MSRLGGRYGLSGKGRFADFDTKSHKLGDNLAKS